jgi:hypothetical protein
MAEKTPIGKIIELGFRENSYRTNRIGGFYGGINQQNV